MGFLFFRGVLTSAYFEGTLPDDDEINNFTYQFVDFLKQLCRTLYLFQIASFKKFTIFFHCNQK